jgi:hypothetical protein
MAIGPGKYDEVCTVAREATNAKATILIIVGGKRGSGFSMQIADTTIMLDLPATLRGIAEELERDSRGIYQ